MLLDEVAQDLASATELNPVLLRHAKRHGFSDAQIAEIRGMPEAVVRGVRHALGIRPVYKTVDTCAGEFEAHTPYHYSSYDTETEVTPGQRPKVIILGSGPNRIGQGVEFDYSCVHASFALRDAGYETVMVNCNPETVSTDYDTSDRLYFEPLTLEDVLEVVAAEQATGEVVGVVVQLGGQTPLGLAQSLKDAGVPIVGTSPEAIHLAEDRGAFGRVLAKAGLPAPKHGMAFSFPEAKAIADEVGYPVLVRPSYVLGGRGMEIVYSEEMLADYILRATEISADRPVLVDRFLDDAVEIDVDALFDGEELFLGGVMEHIEEAGIHSGDSACVLPPITLGNSDMDRIRTSTEAIARGVGVLGLLNVQYAIAADVLYVLEANPRASRTVPFVSKATATPLAKAAARVMLGATIAELRAEGMLPPRGDCADLPFDAPIAVKEAVMPFNRFRTASGEHVDTILGPEMRSTGEVMGIDTSFGTAFAKSQAGAYGSLPTKGTAFVSVANRDKRSMVFPVKRLADLGFEILATQGTAEVLRRNGVSATVVRKGHHGPGPDGEPTIVTRIKAGEVALIVNTPFGVGTPGGRVGHPDRRRGLQHPVRHDRGGARGRGAGDRGAADRGARGVLAAGVRGAAPRQPGLTVRHMLYEKVARPALFKIGGGDAEAAHGRMVHTLARLDAASRAERVLTRVVPMPRAPRTVFGIRFDNPVGLAAGMDKDAVAIPAWAALGLGFVEVGTVTWHPQPGNPTPRLFRLPSSAAIINRMGFNNAGAVAVAARLKALGPARIPIGISLGKSKITPVQEATADYLASLRLLLPYADYIAVNVSSPNTPGLRSLQDRGALDELLGTLTAHVRADGGGSGGRPTPLLLKIAPDLTEPAVAEILEVCATHGVAGIIATNTTIARAGLAPADAARGAEAGGLSGRPLYAAAVRMVAFIARETGGTLPIVGVGGILHPDDALRMFDAGASLVQLYTGLVYRGPGLVRGITKAVAARGSVGT